MSDWTGIGNQSWEAAKLLLNADHHRSCCSRAYFAAYADLGHDSAIRAVSERIEQKHDPAVGHRWWVVPVEVAVAKPRMCLHYEVLDAVEQHLEETDVLLVPLVPEEQAA